MSPTWPTVPVSATSAPLRNTGVTTAMSNRWPAHSHGSLVTSTSPGFSVSGGNFSSSAFTARGKVRLNTGMARGECASESPTRIEQVAGEVLRLRDDQRERGAADRVPHLLDHGD